MYVDTFLGMQVQESMSMLVFFHILAHRLSLFLNGIDECFDTCLSMQIQDNMSIAAHLCLSITTRLAHLAVIFRVKAC